MNCYSNQTRSGFYALRNKAASFESDYEPVKKIKQINTFNDQDFPGTDAFAETVKRKVPTSF